MSAVTTERVRPVVRLAVALVNSALALALLPGAALAVGALAATPLRLALVVLAALGGLLLLIGYWRRAFLRGAFPTRSRAFWLASAAYNVAAFAFWALNPSDLPLFEVLLLTWTALVVGVSVAEARWSGRSDAVTTAV